MVVTGKTPFLLQLASVAKFNIWIHNLKNVLRVSRIKTNVKQIRHKLQPIQNSFVQIHNLLMLWYHSE